MNASEARRWVVVGANGMLGTEVMSQLEHRNVRGLDLPDIDITDPASVEHSLADADVVVNCAAYTAVDDAETNEGIAFLVNAVGPANLARQCAKTGAKLIQISTDYVFDGAADQPYTEGAAPSPRSAYGRTKLAGEWAVRAELPQSSYILRTAWLYGAAGPNFAATMARLEGERESVAVVDDQFGQPTWARDLAQRIVETVDTEAPFGIYHATNSGRTSWFGFAQRVFELVGAQPQRVQPTTTEAFPRPAPRPANSVLSHDGWRRAGLAPMRSWDDALAAAWADGLVAYQRK
ncbi:MAG: dTDP-4-dehydrorhamnose reductase [Candidatus Nanopelagicales bacterium]